MKIHLHHSGNVWKPIFANNYIDSHTCVIDWPVMVNRLVTTLFMINTFTSTFTCMAWRPPPPHGKLEVPCTKSPDFVRVLKDHKRLNVLSTGLSFDTGQWVVAGDVHVVQGLGVLWCWPLRLRMGFWRLGIAVGGEGIAWAIDRVWAIGVPMFCLGCEHCCTLNPFRILFLILFLPKLLKLFCF